MTHLRSYMIKGVAAILLAAILQTYICSTFCSIESQCMTHHEKIEKNCCSKEESRQSENKDCQKDHMAFLKTVGQFHAYDAPPLEKVFECDLINFPQIDIHYISYNNQEFATGFHPPPPKDGISVLVQSFLI